jgi:N6-adenosine-specific RNA methylase IME4
LKKYNVIYADPPWTFDTYSEKGKEHKSAELHYNTMSMADIQALPVSRIAADDCVLFLWVTSPMLLDGLKTIETWGFTYKTIGFNWFKQNKIADSWFWGLGYWTRQNTELCLLATRGKPTRASKGVHQVLDEFIDTEPIASKLGAHSEKPAAVRERIVALCGDVPRIELFARQQTLGWDATGLELTGEDIREFLGKVE